MERETAYKKIIHFCEYQERSKQEAYERLMEWGLDETFIPSIIEQLVGNNYINEDRFAREYAHGKFKIKGWGKIRIRQGLYRKGISEDLILKGLNSIEEEEYRDKVISLIEKKMELEQTLNPLEKNQKVAKYVISHGFEPELIWDILKQVEI